MKQKQITCSLSLVFFLGALVSPASFAENSSASPMQTLANTSPQTTITQQSTQPATPAQPTITPSTAANPAETAEPTPAAIDCSYTVPETNISNPINPETIIQWANHAALQTFTYDFRNYDKQFNELKRCYTTAGWSSFENAMKASNNLKVTQDEHLFVSAKINGQSQLLSENAPDSPQLSWSVRVPVLVSYQNQDREVSQDMYVDLTIKTQYGVPTRLGINQIVASPKTANIAPQ